MNECFYCGWVGRGGEKGGKERGNSICKRTLSLCFRASAAGVGFRRSTART